ncbi:MAG TPA: cytochrome c [Gammaproteobacteria bacterium]|nr:cytochrome c [Gammaproteobacteria bacterium]
MALAWSWRCRAGAVRLLSTAAIAAACSGNAFAQRAADESQSGAELFQQFCASCHGSTGRGDGPVAQTLNAAVPDLTRLSERRDGEFPADDVRATIDGRGLAISHGTRLMPVWGYRFWVDAGADIQAQAQMHSIINRLVSYLESVQVRSTPEP